MTLNLPEPAGTGGQLEMPLLWNNPDINTNSNRRRQLTGIFDWFGTE